MEKKSQVSLLGREFSVLISCGDCPLCIQESVVCVCVCVCVQSLGVLDFLRCICGVNLIVFVGKTLQQFSKLGPKKLVSNQVQR